MAAPVVGIVCGLFTLVLILIYLTFEAKKAQKSNYVFEADDETLKVLEQADQLEKDGKLPNVILAVLAISGVSYKDGYKHLFVVTVVITLLALALGLVLGNILYPIAV